MFIFNFVQAIMSSSAIFTHSKSNSEDKRLSFSQQDKEDYSLKNSNTHIKNRVKRGGTVEIEEDDDFEIEEEDEAEEDNESYGMEKDERNPVGPSDGSSAPAENGSEKGTLDTFFDSNSDSNERSVAQLSPETPQYFEYNCRIPDVVTNAEILCTKWHDAVSCNLYCTHGYKFDEGIMRTTSCHFKEGKWTKKFKNCEPFADCTLQLKSAGDLSCKAGYLKKGTTCRVLCENYDKKDKPKTRVYHCDEHGRWVPSLPDCVQNEGIDVVNPPFGETATHRKFEYPKNYPF